MCFVVYHSKGYILIQKPLGDCLCDILHLHNTNYKKNVIKTHIKY